MKRYSLSDGGIRGNFDMVMSEHSRGEWVKWEDVENLLNNLGHDASVAGFHHRISRLESIECNCVEMAHGIISGEPVNYQWFCPAHGYKKR